MNLLLIRILYDYIISMPILITIFYRVFSEPYCNLARKRGKEVIATMIMVMTMTPKRVEDDVEVEIE